MGVRDALSYTPRVFQSTSSVQTTVSVIFFKWWESAHSHKSSSPPLQSAMACKPRKRSSQGNPQSFPHYLKRSFLQEALLLQPSFSKSHSFRNGPPFSFCVYVHVCMVVGVCTAVCAKRAWALLSNSTEAWPGLTPAMKSVCAIWGDIFGRFPRPSFRARSPQCGM